MNCWKKAVKFVRKLWNSFSTYSAESSIHSLNYIGKKNLHWVERIFWILAFSISLSTCSYLIIKTYEKWENDPVLVAFNERSTPTWKIPFPAITICPETKTDVDKFNLTKVLNLVNKRKSLTENEKKGFEALAQICDDSLPDKVRTRKPNIAKNLRDISNDFVTHSEYSKMGRLRRHDYNIDMKQHFKEIITDEGICYSTNMLANRDFYKNETDPTLLIKKRKFPLSNWTIFGYEKENDPKAYPKRIIGSGIKNGKHLNLRMLRKDLNYLCKGPVNGFRLTLHTPDEMPRPSVNFIMIPFGVETLISVKPRVMTTSKNLKPYKPEQRQCYFPEEKKLKFFKSYSQSNCKLECQSDFLLKACKCVKFSIPHARGTNICRSRNCVDAAESYETFLEYGTKVTDKLEKVKDISVLENSDYRFSPYKNISMLDSTTDDNNKTIVAEDYEKCNCLPACSSIQYDAEVSQSNLNIEEYYKSINPVYEKESKFHHASVMIYFKDEFFIETTRTELYGWLNFLSSCGGFLGLLMGGSFLSLIEILYHLTLRKVFVGTQKIDVKNDIKII